MTLYNLARMTTNTVGTGIITLDEAVRSFLSFDRAGVQDGETITYAIEDVYDREIGRGIYDATAKTLTRDVIFKSTNDDDPLDLSGGAQIAITAAAEDIREAVGQRGPEGVKGDPGDLTEASSDGVPYFRKNGVWVPMTFLTGTLTASIVATVANGWHDGPTVNVGNEGTWYVSGVVSFGAAGQAVSYVARLWDGTTSVADACTTTHQAGFLQSISLSGVIANPTGPLRMSVASVGGAFGWIGISRDQGYWTQLPAPTNLNYISALRIG